MNNHAIKSGLITGVISIVLSLLIYIVDPTIFAIWWLMLLLMLFYVGVITYFGIQHRNQEGGYLSFGKSWVYSFTALVSYSIVGTLFSILLFTVIDPELSEIVTDAVVEKSEAMMRNFGMPDDQLDEALEKTRNDTLERFTIAGSLKGFAWGLVANAVLSLIAGAIIKKKEPELEG
ncbi:MAG: DUF4199 domain-containing protein [Ekhidna sp.]|uniref:DUF4199 domain-containing protein n=1 Tax=Ekhidna sp. TaxID=2608089 RepID=UPI0032EE3B84